MKKKVLLFARDPGGANVIEPLIEPIQTIGHDVGIFAKDIALDMIKNAKDIMSEVDEISEEAVFEFLRIKKPDYVITATSGNDNTERFLWSACKRMNTPSFAVLDQWMNHGIRFSKYWISDYEQFEKDKALIYLPDIIFALDGLCRAEMIEEGIPQQKIIVSGGTYLEKLLFENNIETEKVIDFKKQFNCNKLITFASEPMCKTYGEQTAKATWGYTEKTVFLDLMESLKRYNIENTCVVIRLHPKEDTDNYDQLLRNYPEFKFIVDKSLDKMLLMEASDLVIGMSSMFIIEAFLRKRDVLSIQTGLCDKNPFILHKLGILHSALNAYELDEKIDNYFKHGSIVHETYDHSIHKGAVQRVIKTIFEFKQEVGI